MAIGTRELSQGWERFRDVYRSRVWDVFSVLCAIECFAILCIPTSALDATARLLSPLDMAGTFGVLDGDLAVVVVLSLVLVGVDLIRQCLWVAARDVAIDGEVLSVSDVLRKAFSRVGALFLLHQVVGACVFALAIICMLLGLQFATFPNLLVTFTLAPAAYAVVALRKPIGRSLLQATTISRRNVAAVFGVQSFLAAIAIWVSSLFQGADVGPLMGSYLAVSMLAMYRVFHFAGLGSLFFALEEQGAYAEIAPDAQA
jgi:hypothetical protein